MVIKQGVTEIFYQTQAESELPEWIDEYAPFATEAVALMEEYGQASYQNERREVVKWLNYVIVFVVSKNQTLQGY